MRKVQFLTTSNQNNGYGMTRQYFKKYLPREGIELVDTPQHTSLVLNTPPGIQFAKGNVKVLYTMIEGDELPPSWLPYVAQADHVIVPTTFVQKAFKKAGFDALVMPLGYDSSIFSYVPRQPLGDRPYKFFHYEAFQNRKGWQDLLDAWLLSGLAEEEFECQLILKTIKPIDEVMAKLDKMFVPSNVKIISGELPHHCLFDLLVEVDCFVFPSRGEGFSLPPIEAMATGLPVILTKGHSHMDYYNEDYMYGVDCNVEIPARYHNWEDQGNFVRCKVEDLAKTLRHVYDNQQEAREKGIASVEYISKYRYDKSIAELAEFLWRV
jgi:glycosyltransferase involved in cell wall biosynthesis